MTRSHDREALLALLIIALSGATRAETPSLPWQKWEPALFDRAAAEDKYILLHMAAVWCHVMEGTTYKDPAVQKTIGEKFIPERVDQDRDPALSYRYENWGWPATIMLDKDGNEIFTRRGYIPPELFSKLLAAVIEDPSALPGFAVGVAVDPDAVLLSPQRRANVEALVLKNFDKDNGAFDWTMANRRAPNGGIGHLKATDDDTHLGDTLAMAEAALQLYRSTAERRYLALAIELGEIVVRDHYDATGGFMVRQPEPGARGVLAKPVKQIDENVAATRLLNLLARQTNKPALRASAQHGMRWLISLAEDGLVVPRALLADRELSREPAHVTIVGAKDDPDARALYQAARAYPTRYLRIEWLDRREGRLPMADVDYPDMPQAAAYACANGACSVPVFTPAEVHRIVAKVDDR